MNDGGRSYGAAAAIFDDCYHLACDFVQASFMHRHRETNFVAHEPAKMAKFGSSNEWIDEPPSGLIPLLLFFLDDLFCYPM